MSSSSLMFRTTTRFVISLRSSRTLYTLLRPPPRPPRRHIPFQFSLSRFRSLVCLAAPRLRNSVLGGASHSSHLLHQTKEFGRFAYDDYSDDESDADAHSSRQPGSSTLDNLDEWKWKLTMLLRNQDEQEVVSRERKDRRDFEQLSAMATRMGLHSRQYSKVIVFSKVPLPNYRHDLDDKRPQREVVLPSDLQKDIDCLLKRHLAHKTNIMPALPGSFVPNNTAALNNREVSYKFSEPSAKMSAVKERILLQKSELLRKRQQDWQESQEGQKMIEFRRSLPAHKERDALLKTISENQVVAEVTCRVMCLVYEVPDPLTHDH